MGTIWEDLTRNHVHEALRDPEQSRLLLDYVDALAKGEFERRYVKAIVQNWRRAHDVTIYDAYDFAQVHTLIVKGVVAIYALRMPATPGPDRDIIGNNRALSKVIRKHKADVITGAPVEFEAEFDNKCLESDGYFGWTGTITCSYESDNSHVFVSDRQVPLEVGSTSGSRTLGHLIEDGGVARWPYGETCLMLFLLPDHKRDYFFREREKRDSIGGQP